MAVTSPRIAVRNDENIPSCITPPRFDNGLPLQQSVSSASPMPTSPRVNSTSPLLSNPQYIEQIRAVIEQQRQLHEKERALWNTENQALQAKVAQLEASLRWYKGRNSGSEVVSPLDDRSGTTFGTFGGFPPGKGPKAIATSTGDEFWRGAGGKSNAVPTRTFSDPTPSCLKLENKQMPSIPEDAISQNPSRSLSLDTHMGPLPRYYHAVGIADHTIDGIIFKPTAPATPLLKSATTPDSLSPGHSPPTRISPSLIRLNSKLLAQPTDPYVQDAGHTPLARFPPPGLDGSSSDNVSPLTPPTLGEPDRPPLEPRPSVARPPTERAASYFPPPAIDEDRALSGPLGLRNHDVEDRSFLDEVSSKLRDVARSRSDATADQTAGAGSADGGGAREFDPEPEPRLRIKRSMNFGSSWGASSCGKGV